MEHLSDAQIEALVAGPAEARARAHVATCPQCAARLAREARLELALHDLAAGSPDPASPERWWPVAFAAAAGLVVVGVLIAYLSGATRAVRKAAPQRDTISAGATPSADVPCLQDPRLAGPGATALPPTNLCRWVTAPSAPEPPM